MEACGGINLFPLTITPLATLRGERLDLALVIDVFFGFFICHISSGQNIRAVHPVANRKIRDEFACEQREPKPEPEPLSRRSGAFARREGGRGERWQPRASTSAARGYVPRREQPDFPF
jgi:hypothetical protein